VRQFLQPSAVTFGAVDHIKQARDRQLTFPQGFRQPGRPASACHLNGKHHHWKRNELWQKIDKGQAAGQGKNQQQKTEGALFHQVR
jgi:hypothetical protein